MSYSWRNATAILAGLLGSGLICLIAAPSASQPIIQTHSDVKGVSLIALGTLPHSPDKATLDEYCEGYRAKELTPVGKQVAKLGWIVTSEGQLGRFHVVTFAGGFDPGTSAMCFARSANIAIFDGDKLTALAFTPARSAKAPLGVVEPLENGGPLVLTDSPGVPIGELHADGSELLFTAVAPERTFCGRRAVVPNVYGMPIKVARRVLTDKGWTPRRPLEQPNENWIAGQLRTRGILEAENCSGTGVGYCSFNYRGAAGLLRVTTAGDDNKVVSYEVECTAG